MTSIEQNTISTEIPKLEDDAPPPPPHFGPTPSPPAKWENGRGLYFGTNAFMVMTTGAIEAILAFPPQSWEIGWKPPFYKQKVESGSQFDDLSQGRGVP